MTLHVASTEFLSWIDATTNHIVKEGYIHYLYNLLGQNRLCINSIARLYHLRLQCVYARKCFNPLPVAVSLPPHALRSVVDFTTNSLFIITTGTSPTINHFICTLGRLISTYFQCKKQNDSWTFTKTFEHNHTCCFIIESLQLCSIILNRIQAHLCNRIGFSIDVTFRDSRRNSQSPTILSLQFSSQPSIHGKLLCCDFRCHLKIAWKQHVSPAQNSQQYCMHFW
jgi:hypothetical protein